MKIESLLLWAAVSIPGPRSRSRWIHHHTIRRTRRESRAAYVEGWNPDYVHEALAWVEFRRVVVSVQEAT